MLSRVSRILKALLITIIAVLFITFAVVNREAVKISLFPLPYEAQLPAFLLAILCFALGSIIGWMTLSLRLSKTKREAKTEHKRVVALQHEIDALHAEQERPIAPAIASDL